MQPARRSAPGRGGTGRVTAVLGPTNTGKTHLAVERMLGHRSGMIGCPLRLLAREVYDRVVEARGAGQAALVTGEERIVPARPRYWVCTVESMPTDRAVEFLAIDEIQLATDPDRGHVFTDRILHARGISETMLLGAATMTPVLRRLAPEAAFVRRPRFSTLVFRGARKITRLPPRSAVIAFSAAEVYRAAEILRRFRGGAAVVMGALSPRTRNAQVALYQSGEVDYLVATDAIGMGLNLDLDHVAFAGLGKFDGREWRDLEAGEIGQIAGRAGRHMRDGSFGTTLDSPALDRDTADAVERHAFDPAVRVRWRNARLDLSSPAALLRSLEAPPPAPELARPREADDLAALRALSHMPGVAARAVGYDAVSLLWRVCRVPDFRKTVPDEHHRLLAALWRHLSGPSEVLPDAWVARMVDRLDRTDGDIEMLATRLAHVRTWNYVAWRRDWVADAAGLRARARALEDRLSDALHERLTRRFVDRRAARLARRLKERPALAAAVDAAGAVTVEGESIGRLSGFRFVPDDADAWATGRALRAAVRRALDPAIRDRARSLAAAPDGAFALAPDGAVTWAGAPVARLARAAAPLRPALRLVAAERLPERLRDEVERRLAAWIDAHIAHVLAPLFKARRTFPDGPVGGLLFRIAEAGGGAAPRPSGDVLRGLGSRDRKTLAETGVSLGSETIFMPALLESEPMRLRALLWCVHNARAPVAPPAGQASMPLGADTPAAYCRAVGYWPVGGRAVRVDRLERLVAALRRRARAGPVALDNPLRRIVGCSLRELAAVVEGLGWRAVTAEPDGGVRYVPPRRRPSRRARRAVSGAAPFAALAQLKTRLPCPRPAEP